VNQRRSLYRKVVYLCAIAALLIPLSFLSQPATTQSSGGKLAKLRGEYELSQANLGDIDPASETIKLATLGMRGVAANILWEKANDCKKREDWTGLSATLQQITRLQPNFVSVWRFQAWNLSYNVAVEFDDYHDRYYWLMKGVDFLKEGISYNAREPILLWDIGWFISQKIGRADDHKQYRQLFKEDDDFHGSRPLAQRDNWLVGQEWFIKGQQLVDKFGLAIKGTSPLIFHSNPGMCLINYADTLEEEGTFGEVAKTAWKKAEAAWQSYGNRDLPTTWNVFVRLNDKERQDERLKQATADLEAITPPGLKDEILKEKRAKLEKRELDALDAPADKRTAEQSSLVVGATEKTKISLLEIADRIQGPKRVEALKLAEVGNSAENMSKIIDNERGIVNFEYWRMRGQMERTDEALEARKLCYQAEKAYDDADLVQAKAKYEAGLQKWREVLDAYPQLLFENIEMEDLKKIIDRYRTLLHAVGETFPDPFVLQNVLDANAKFMPQE
jgi:hypothetical protein